MTTVAILFWAGVFLVFYTYLGYGILLWLLVKIREAVHPARRYAFPADPPEVTLLIAAYNEQEVVAEKMANCRALDYPAGKNAYRGCQGRYRGADPAAQGGSHDRSRCEADGRGVE